MNIYWPLIGAEIIREHYRYDGKKPQWPDGLAPLEFECADTDTQYIYGVLGDVFYIGFPGTSSLRDVVTDVMAYKKTIPYGNSNTKIRIHAGFLKAYCSVRKDVLLLVQKHAPKKVVVFGHSLGAALATLCAVDIEYNVAIKPDVYVTGTPRVGNKAFRNSYNRRVPGYVRFQNKLDFVTAIPFINYYHAGKCVKLKTWWHNIKNYIKGLGREKTKLNDTNIYYMFIAVCASFISGAIGATW